MAKVATKHAITTVITPSGAVTFIEIAGQRVAEATDEQAAYLLSIPGYEAHAEAAPAIKTPAPVVVEEVSAPAESEPEATEEAAKVKSKRSK